MRFGELTARLTGQRLHPERDPEIRRITVDSREVEPGDLFVALVWPTADAHPYVPEAVSRGAVALIVQVDGALPRGYLEPPPPLPVLVVKQAAVALAEVSDAFNGRPTRPPLQVVAVTGTNGKTTTTALLEAVFQEAGRPCGVIGTLFFRLGMWEIHGRHTTPQAHQLFSLLRAFVDRGARVVAMEASSHGLALHRMDGVLVDVGVFTNLSHDHLDFHRGLDDYFGAKRRLFDELLPASREAGKPGVAAINHDDPWGRRLIDELEPRRGPGPPEVVVTYGLEPGAAVTVRDLDLSPLASRFTLVGAGGDEAPVELGLVGRHNVSNALAAAAAAEALGVEVAVIAAGLSAARTVRGRVERVRRDDGDGPTVFVDYAHTPDALAHVLDTLRELSPGRLHVVFGCGGDRDARKRPVMGRLAAEKADSVMVTSDNPRGESPQVIIDAIVAGAREAVADGAAASVSASADRRAAIVEAVRGAASDDVVLIAGKGHETTQEIAGVRSPFDDVVVAREALAGWSHDLAPSAGDRPGGPA